MHELSIAMSIVEICTAEAHKAKATMVSKVELEVGTMSGVETEALEFAWDAATHNSCAEGASLIIQKMSAAARCKDCSAEFPVDNFYNPCPSCNNFGYDIIQGKELRIKAITVE